MKLFILLQLILISSFSITCHGAKHNHANHHMNKTSFDELTKSFESKERDKWQKPDEVIQFIDKKVFGKSKTGIAGKKIGDLGSGTGYFTLRFLDAGASAIALDIDDRFLNYINTRTKDHKKKTLLELRKINEGELGLKEGEVDLVFTVNTYHHFENRISFLSMIKKSIKKDGALVIIDFKEGDLPIHAPPESMKIKTSMILDELDKAGFQSTLNRDLLEFQNIFVAVPK
ncbi:MAG: methyltransferase domain-containing protein [Leptospiraceae bacterium]|nr:methyltransferase domain-containing protein [Leptospiraceae bacterium]